MLRRSGAAIQVKKIIHHKETSMKKNVEARAAFEVWNKMAELENILWDHYYEAFCHLILDKEEREEFNSRQDDLENEDLFL
jgi:hypothetical protein